MIFKLTLNIHGIDKNGMYENDEKQGEWISYFYNGDIAKRFNYINEIMNGTK